jgi:hypothetical protein
LEKGWGIWRVDGKDERKKIIAIQTPLWYTLYGILFKCFALKWQYGEINIIRIKLLKISHITGD